jgi:hypothetical protein
MALALERLDGVALLFDALTSALGRLRTLLIAASRSGPIGSGRRRPTRNRARLGPETVMSGLLEPLRVGLALRRQRLALLGSACVYSAACTVGSL